MSNPSILVKHPSAAQVVAEITAVAAGESILTDADGTLWAGDAGDDLVRCAAQHTDVWRDAIDVEAYLALAERDYLAACCASAELLRNVDLQAARPLLRAYLGETLSIRKYLVEALNTANARGVRVVVISASPAWVVQTALELFNVSVSRSIGIELDGGQPGKFVQPVPVDEGKVAAWQQLELGVAALAFGDTQWDLPLLQSARRGLLLTKAQSDPALDHGHSRYTCP